MRVLLVSTYDLGRQPFGLAAPAAWLRRDGGEVECVDVSRETLSDAQIGSAGIVAFYLPMHTATRLAAPIIERVRRVNPGARLAAYGLYAPLNAAWLREQGVGHVLGPDAGVDLVALTRTSNPPEPGARNPEADQRPQARDQRLSFIQPDRSTMLPLSRYAALQMPDGTRRVVGSTDATHGCKHLCRHCPIVPVYGGRFSAVPLDLVLEDVRAQVSAGAQHISFGDPDFLNGPTHARRLVERFAREFPGLTYDATIKIEHILRHADMLSLLRDTGCLLITSAVESVDDRVLEKLRKGHTRADFVRAVELCRGAGVALTPTFVPFTPWTTAEGYLDLLEQLDRLGLRQDVAPIQLAIRLLITSQSALLELPDIQAAIEPFEARSLTYPWRHADPRVDMLQRDVMQIVTAGARSPRPDVFERIVERARAAEPAGAGQAMAGATGKSCCSPRSWTPGPQSAVPPYMTEGWYCCAEPGPEQVDLM